MQIIKTEVQEGGMFSFLCHGISLWFSEVSSKCAVTALDLLAYPEGTTLHAFGALYEAIANLLLEVSRAIDVK